MIHYKTCVSSRTILLCGCRKKSPLRSVETGPLGLERPAAAGSPGETLQQLVVSVRSVPMGGRRSPQALAPIVKRIPAKVLVHAEPADAAAVATGRRGRSAAEYRVVTAAAAAALDATTVESVSSVRASPGGKESHPRKPNCRSNRSRGSS